MGLFSDLFSWASGGDTSGSYDEANKILEQRKKEAKGAQQLLQEGRAAAGQSAADKAGEAKKAAVGASKMAGASRLTAATQGAAAAEDASQQGYSETANQAMAAEAQKEKQLSDIASQQASNITGQAESEAKRKQSQVQSAMGLAGLVLSDGKAKRHSYIAKEDR